MAWHQGEIRPGFFFAGGFEAPLGVEGDCDVKAAIRSNRVKASQIQLRAFGPSSLEKKNAFWPGKIVLPTSSPIERLSVLGPSFAWMWG